MSNKEILQNAPEGATHFDGFYFWVKFDSTRNWHYLDRYNRWSESAYHDDPKPKTETMRPISDIKALVEKDERIAELEKISDEHKVLLCAIDTISKGLIDDPVSLCKGISDGSNAFVRMGWTNLNQIYYSMDTEFGSGEGVVYSDDSGGCDHEVFITCESWHAMQDMIQRKGDR